LGLPETSFLQLTVLRKQITVVKTSYSTGTGPNVIKHITVVIYKFSS